MKLVIYLVCLAVIAIPSSVGLEQDDHHNILEGGLHSLVQEGMGRGSDADADSSTDGPDESVRPSDFDPTGGVFSDDPVVRLDGTPPDPGMEEREPTVSSLAVCEVKPLMQDSRRKQTATCRMYITDRYTGRNSVCTAWFVEPNVMVTAGHCVANRPQNGEPRWRIDWSRGPRVCCEAQDDFTCAGGAVYDIQRAATTKGWLRRGKNVNDAATIRVERRRDTTHSPGLWTWESAHRPQMCDKQWWYWAGYPAKDRRPNPKDGCGRDWDELKHYHIEHASILNCEDVTAMRARIALDGGSCGGMSGGPVFNYDQNAVVAVLASSSIDCIENRSSMYATPITRTQHDVGVNLQALIDLVI